MAWSKKTDIEKIREYNRKYYAEKIKQKRLLKRQETVKKTCPICKTEFTPTEGHKIYCCEACRKIGDRIRETKYSKSEKCKEKNKRYRESESYKESQKKYRSSETFKETRREYMKKYAKSEAFKKAQKKYAQSEKGKATQKRYAQSEKGKATQKRYLAKGKDNDLAK